jgi:hypothetical protein
MSPELADVISWWANWILVGALVVGMLATYAIVVSGNVKEANLKRELAEQARRTAEAELARAKIEARLAPRLLPQSRQNELASKLSKFKGQRVTIVASPSTPESEMFARTLGAPLKDAGWELTILPGTATATYLFPTGVIIAFAVDVSKPVILPTNTEQEAASNVLAEFLNGLGIDATAQPSSLPPGSTIQITISTK